MGFFTRTQLYVIGWGEEQQLGFVVLPKLKIDDAMYDSTYPTAKTREEQQQMWAKLLFYHSKKLIETHNSTIP